KAIDALTGVTIAGKAASAELARERVAGEAEREAEPPPPDPRETAETQPLPRISRVLRPEPAEVVDESAAADATGKASAAPLSAEPPTAPRAPLATPLTDFGGEGQALIDANASVTPAGGALPEGAPEDRETAGNRGPAEITRAPIASEDARGGTEEPPVSSKPG